MTIVVKYGGAAMQSEELKHGVAEDIVLLLGAGIRVVLVHGGGPELSALQKRLGIPARFVEGLRYTDAETMDAALMVLCGRVNKGLVRLIENAGGRAAGLAGIDGGLLRCVKKDSPELGFVGELTQVDTEILKVLLDAGYVPVVSTVGLGEEGLAYNINADTAAAGIAAALHADRFLTLSDIPGILRDVKEPSSLLARVRLAEIEPLIMDGVITGGMIPKARGLAEAVRAGVGAASILDGRVPHVLALAFAAADAAADAPGTTVLA